MSQANFVPVRATVLHLGRVIATRVVPCPSSERHATRDRFKWHTAHAWVSSKMRPDYNSVIAEISPGKVD